MGPHTGQVRVLSPDGVLAGAGVLVALDGSPSLHVITCAHVVDDVGGLSRFRTVDGAAAGTASVLVDLPGRGWSAKAVVVEGSRADSPLLDVAAPGHRAEECGDFVALALVPGSPPLPEGCRPLPLAPCGEPVEQPVLVLGYPEGLSDGIVTAGRLIGVGGACPLWVQLEGVQSTGAPFERGFSGAAVWDPDKGRVVGMVTAAHARPETKVAWMLPVEAAIRFWAPLGGAVRTPEPRACEPPPVEAQLGLADALLEIPQIEYDSGKALRMALPRAVRRNVRDHAYPRHQVQALIAACLDHRDGCPALRAAVAELGGDTASTREALGVLDRLCCGGGA
ncbi:trypsin-like peptidase domain-containing protein [Streptomyces sp. NPDC087440]|uniref:trypsin-like peptidase domain-containing protein n=1 Tax=Streptomyces sp. NPDC087440 TaxID=3365790 RepID=UPI00381E3A8E